MMGTDYRNATTGTDATMDEAGAQDNRMSLDPSNPQWKDTVGSWEDGKTYTMTVTLRQISPGEFEVLKAQAENESPAEDSTESGEEEMPMRGGMNTGNPAIDDMIANGERK